MITVFLVLRRLKIALALCMFWVNVPPGAIFAPKVTFELKVGIMLKFWNFHKFLRITLKFNFARPRPPTLYNPNEFLTFLSPGIAKSDFFTKSSTFCYKLHFCENIGNFSKSWKLSEIPDFRDLGFQNHWIHLGFQWFGAMGGKWHFRRGNISCAKIFSRGIEFPFLK